jgi:putative ABC transport system permease protein
MRGRLLIESFIQAWQSLVAHRLRTSLSLLGVMIGIFMISAVFAVADSLETNLRGAFSMVRNDVLFVEKMPWTFSEGYPWWKYVTRPDVTLAEAEQLEGRLTMARSVAFQTGGFAEVSRLNNSKPDAQLAAVTVNYPDAVELNLSDGRFFSEREVSAAMAVAVIGHNIADRLFPNGGALGGEMKVEGRPVRVVGILEIEGSSMISGGVDDVIFVPVTFGKRLINFRAHKSTILVRAHEGGNLEALRGEITAALRPIRRLHPGDELNFAINEVQMLTSFIDSIFDQLAYGVWFIGAFAILVGCFSIANIMFVTVKERTPIIGVQKAMGAKRSFILTQFLLEAIALCIFGALLALALLGVMTLIVNVVSDSFTLEMRPERFLMGLLIAVVSGVLAGLAPALKAARMDPVEAMRSV